MSGARLTERPQGAHTSLTGSGRSEVGRDQAVEVVSVKRYWPGKAPAWAAGQADDARPRDVVAAPTMPPPPPPAPAAGQAAADRPRERFAGAVVVTASVALPATVLARADADEDEEDDIDARRARARARARAEKESHEQADRIAQPPPPQQQQRAPPPGGRNEDVSEDETDSGSEGESDDSGSEEAQRVLLKPVFVPKASRETILAQQAAEEGAQAEERRLIEKLAERRKETLELVVESARLEQEGLSGDADADMPDDADDEDDLQEYSDWKLREIRRVKAERDEREAAERELAETERRRSLTEEERAREDAALAKDAQPAEKTERKFLQKYFHKGAFFQGNDSKGNPLLGEIMKRDFGQATGADTVDKASLPKPMQVKKFGFRSQVKWTHLSNEDTTNREEHLPTRRQQGGGDSSSARHDSRAGDAFSRPSTKRPRT